LNQRGLALSHKLWIAVVGDFDPSFEPHGATDGAVRHAAQHSGMEVEARWISTPALEHEAGKSLFAAAGYWIAPGSPYKSMAGALKAIQIAREQGVPLLGTCAGFQHVVIEFARNVLGFRDAEHAEYDPNASNLFVTPLSCSLAGQTMSIEIKRGSRTSGFYGALAAQERYYCNFGLNPAHQQLIDDGGLRIVGVDRDNEARVLEISEHPFFVATLFVPQARSTPDDPHPLICAFLEAAAAYQATRSAVASTP
jgi:CTP synthase (UTP-ammonia lyase)